MAESARVESVDALKGFRSVLIKFAEAVNVALADAEAEMQRLGMWLENEQIAHWSTELRKRQEWASRCKEAVRMKKVFKDSAGSRSSAVEEEKALRLAEQRLAEAQWKISATKTWSRKLTREIQSYKGGVMRLATAAQGDIPQAAATLEKFMAALEAYGQLQVTDNIVDVPPPPDEQPPQE